MYIYYLIFDISFCKFFLMKILDFDVFYIFFDDVEGFGEGSWGFVCGIFVVFGDVGVKVFWGCECRFDGLVGGGG